MPVRQTDCPYRSATTLLAPVALPYASANTPRKGVDLPYTHRPQARSAVLCVYGSLTGAVAANALPYLGGASLVRTQSDLGYAVTDRAAVRQETGLVYWHLDAGAATDATAATVSVAGAVIDPLAVEVAWGRDQYCLTATLTVGTEGEYSLFPPGRTLSLTLNGAPYALIVESRARRRMHESSEYTIACLSPASRLDEPYAETVSGQYQGLASVVAQALAGAVPLAWNTVDWIIPPATLLVTDQSPLAVIRSLVAACGAVLLSLPDGSLSVEPSYPVALPEWRAVTPSLVLREILDVFDASETDDYRPGYTVFSLSDQLTAAETLRIEETADSSQLHLLRVYQTPWADDFTLRHTGGDWVQIEDAGIEERQETEVVEFVAGESRTRFPVYGLTTLTWMQVNLGSVTFAEEGRLVAAVEGESLLSVTYTTRCHLFRARSARVEQVQFVAEVSA
jgi:hypothetical protein